MIVRVNKFEPCGQSTYAEVYSLVMRENANIVRQYGPVPETLVRKLINTSLSEVAFNLNLFETSLYEVVLHAFVHKDREGFSYLFPQPWQDLLANSKDFNQPAVIDLKESAFFDIDVDNAYDPYDPVPPANINYGGMFHSYDWAIQYNGSFPIPIEAVVPSRLYGRWSSVLRIQSVQTLFHKSVGPCIKRTTSEINSLAYGSNMIYDREIAWDYNDGVVTLYIGKEVNAVIYKEIPGAIPQGWIPYNENLFTIVAKRKPVMDDLLPPTNDDDPDNPQLYSQTYNRPIDLPDEYLNILLLSLKKKLFEYYGQPFPADMEGKLQMAIRNVIEGDQNELQAEVQEKAVRNV